VMANTHLLTQLSFGNVYHCILIVFLKKIKFFNFKFIYLFVFLNCFNVIKSKIYFIK
jgi:hypothetical protein